MFDPEILPLFGLEGFSSSGWYTLLLADSVFELVLEPVLDPVAEIDEPIVESVFDLLDPMPDSSVGPNLKHSKTRLLNH